MGAEIQNGLRYKGYPFPAIVGQERAKKALLCTLICPEISSILLMGERGTAKSTIVRAMDSLSDQQKVVNLPLNATEERIVGSVDIEKAMLHGKKVIQPGILHDANEKILCIDNINLLDNSLLDIVMNACQSGINVIEREGISWDHHADFVLIGTMDPCEGELSSHMMDRFDLCVCISRQDEPELRKEILRRYLEFEKNPTTFCKRYEKEILELKELIFKAREIFPFVILPEGHIDIICQLAVEMGVHGHRGDLAVSRTARALAALDLREHVLLEDIREAAVLAFEHRRNQLPPPSEQERSENQPDKQSRENPEKEKDNGSQETSDTDSVNTNPMTRKDPTKNSKEDIPDTGSDQVFSIGRSFTVIDYLSEKKRERLRNSRSKGRRSRMISSNRSGRYVASRVPKGKITDIAFDATLRAAAPYQRSRKKSELAVTLEKSDFREKVRLRKKGVTILFLVDASSSMGARKRMTAVKGAILSLLNNAYQKRDAVGMMTFSGNTAELLLPPTRSVDLAYQKLCKLPTGGKTPLAEGLSRSLEIMMNLKARSPMEDIVIVLVSDGRANVPLNGGSAIEDAIAIARRSVDTPIRFVVVDTESGYPRMGFAVNLSAALEGTYFRLEELDAGLLAASVNTIVHSRNNS
ncbi:VWA domain-containing protein [uncultured Methanomethylovorans sp.]|uniref:VWA domain-containing protein n=1 Tax=uncultured Methanomethylovorans sp. TaxID=183759 RepID=UPI002AA661F3|nr:VWA domain-containing protein [uncultured Methanomethylovorans sp.]